ncbi:MAG: hemerythrin domain-containing protein [Deltaproteobacteria bacterium]|nr:hemerythrin domain-containing protein [Deltaproteobacteria bacterium]
MEERNITQFFERDHDRLDALFGQFQKGKRSDFPAAKRAFKEFLTGLQRHIVWEEELLFPAFEQATGMRNVGPTAVMRMEHRQIHQCLEEIHQKVRVQDPESDAEEARLLAVLGQHNMKEEQILYPAIDRMVAPEVRAKLLAEVQAGAAAPVHECCGCG